MSKSTISVHFWRGYECFPKSSNVIECVTHFFGANTRPSTLFKTLRPLDSKVKWPVPDRLNIENYSSSIKVMKIQVKKDNYDNTWLLITLPSSRKKKTDPNLDLRENGCLKVSCRETRYLHIDLHWFFSNISLECVINLAELEPYGYGQN